MSWVFLYSFLLMAAPLSPSDPSVLTERALRGSVEVVASQPADPTGRPQWSNSALGRFLFVAMVIALIFAGAYGIHLYQMKHLHNRADSLEVMVSVRTAEIKRINEVHEEVIDALAETNDALTETNALLESANEQLFWANNQLMHSNRALEFRTDELNFALEQKKEILDTTVHDLKNPLGGVLGLADVIQEDLTTFSSTEEVGETFENLSLIRQAADRMLTDVESLLDRYSKPAQRPLEKEVVYINDIIETTLRWNGQQARNKGLRIYFNGHRERIAASVDVSAMQKVMDNLISNAIKYSALHGKIWVEMVRQKQDVWVSVRDQGPGLSDDDLERVFGRGAVLSAEPTGGEHASGIGLYIVKQIIEQHGGQVGVQSVLGEGAAFWFKISAVEPELSERDSYV